MPRTVLIQSIVLGLSILLTAGAAQTNVQMLVPGFTVRELPVRLSNINSLRFAPDGRLTALGYDGRVHLLADSDGDGLEDRVDTFWDKPTLTVPVGIAWSTHGLYVSSKGKVSLLRDTDGDGRGDTEEVIASDWPATDVGSGGVDATAVTLDAGGNVYFGLLVADYSNAYRLRKRKNLKPAEKAWLAAHGRSSEGDPEEEISLYDINSPRGTIQKWNVGTRTLETMATGIRVPYTLAFNRTGDLFVTDQEGETWMPNGNPLDELNQIIPGRNYGFPPRHPKWLPDVVSQAPVVAFGPQHQSTCGLVFNEPHGPSNRGDKRLPADSPPLAAFPGQGLFGPKLWEGNAIVAGESRGKIWRVQLEKTPTGYVGKEFLIARLNMLTMDVAISPKGDLYVSCQSGPPDWGTGPKGEGKLFKITYTDPQAPQPIIAWQESGREVRVAFDRPIDPGVTNRIREHRLEGGEFVSAADRFEVLKPPYAVVQQQEAALRRRFNLQTARLLEGDRVLAITTESALPAALRFALTLTGISAGGSTELPATVDLDFESQDAGAAFRWTNGKLEMGQGRRMASATKMPKTDLPVSPGGDWQRGRALFASDQLQCARCHQVRGEGGLIGPDLSNLVSRDPASVLRDIREPSASIHPDYTGYTASLKNGGELTGFIRGQDSESIRMVGLDGRETVVPRMDLRELRPGSASLMPEGLIASLSAEQVKDLLTFLVTAPPKAPPASPPANSGLRKEDAKASPPKRSRAQVEAALAVARGQGLSASPRPLDIVLVASKQDHGPGEHDYPWWQTNWLQLLARAEKVDVSRAWEWPEVTQFNHASVLIFNFWNHDWNSQRYEQLDRFLARGGGLMVLHAACIADKEPEALAKRLGLAAQPGRTQYRHGPIELKLVTPRDHALTRGLPATLPFVDETYWPMIGDVGRVEVLATAEEEGKSWPMAWTFAEGRGRVFGSVLGHYSWTFEDPLFRIFVLRGLAWVAGEEAARFDALAVQGLKIED